MHSWCLSLLASTRIVQCFCYLVATFCFHSNVSFTKARCGFVGLQQVLQVRLAGMGWKRSNQQLCFSLFRLQTGWTRGRADIPGQHVAAVVLDYLSEAFFWIVRPFETLVTKASTQAKASGMKELFQGWGVVLGINWSVDFGSWQRGQWIYFGRSALHLLFGQPEHKKALFSFGASLHLFLILGSKIGPFPAAGCLLCLSCPAFIFLGPSNLICSVAQKNLARKKQLKERGWVDSEDVHHSAMRQEYHRQKESMKERAFQLQAWWFRTMADQVSVFVRLGTLTQPSLASTPPLPVLLCSLRSAAVRRRSSGTEQQMERPHGGQFQCFPNVKADAEGKHRFDLKTRQVLA